MSYRNTYDTVSFDAKKDDCIFKINILFELSNLSNELDYAIPIISLYVYSDGTCSFMHDETFGTFFKDYTSEDEYFFV